MIRVLLSENTPGAQHNRRESADAYQEQFAWPAPISGTTCYVSPSGPAASAGS